MFLNIFAVSSALNSMVKHRPPGELGECEFLGASGVPVSILTYTCDVDNLDTGYELKSTFAYLPAHLLRCGLGLRTLPGSVPTETVNTTLEVRVWFAAF